VWLEAGDRLALPVHRAFLGRDQAHQALEQGGLADAVASEQAGDFADLRLERQAAQDMAAAVILMQLLDLQHVDVLVSFVTRGKGCAVFGG